MLASNYRLKKKMFFARAEIDGKLIQSKSFGVQIFDRQDGDNSKFAFVISTKISKRAVVRNKIKRIMSERVRANLLKIKPGKDVIFLVKPKVVLIERNDLESEIDEIITKNL